MSPVQMESGARYASVALPYESARCILIESRERAVDEDPAALARELRVAGLLVQRIGNVVRIVRRPV